MIARRTLLGAMLAAPLPLRAQDRWAGVQDRAAAFDQLHALMIWQNGTPVVERRFRGPSLSRAVNVKSVSKTLVSALLGAAIDRGEVTLDAPLRAVAPGLIPAGADSRVGDITLGDLASLRAGLERTSGPNYGAWIASPDWVADALSRPLVAEPGGPMLYSTGSTHVLGAALAQATGLSLLQQARQRLGAPLGIDVPPWTRDPQGRFLGGNEMALTPNGMVRFGEMFRLGGTWDGSRVLSQAWIETSWTRRTRSPWSGLGYGLGWFLGAFNGQQFALARGYGGQVICVVPGAGLTVAITSDPMRPARSEGYFGDLIALLGDIAAAA